MNTSGGNSVYGRKVGGVPLGIETGNPNSVSPPAVGRKVGGVPLGIETSAMDGFSAVLQLSQGRRRPVGD